MNADRTTRIRHWPRRLLVAGGLLAGLLLAACGGGSGDAATGTSEAGGATTAVADAGGKTEEFGLSERDLAVAIESAETLIASCMTNEGFEYVPSDVVSVRAAMDALGTLNGVSEEDFIAQYGFGISTGGLTEVQSTKLLGDRNISYYADLPAADQVAFDRALLGEDVEATFVFSLDDEDFSSTGGCTGDAIAQVFDAEQLSGSYFNPIDAAIESDPRYLAALEDWQGCMQESGFDYEDSNDAEGSFSEEFDAITDGADPDTLTGSARGALVELQGLEKAVAQADFDCAEEHVNDVEDEIFFELTGEAA